MTGPDDGRLNEYMDEMRARKAAEAKAAEAVVVPDNCMAVGVNLAAMEFPATFDPEEELWSMSDENRAMYRKILDDWCRERQARVRSREQDTW